MTFKNISAGVFLFVVAASSHAGFFSDFGKAVDGFATGIGDTLSGTSQASDGNSSDAEGSVGSDSQPAGNSMARRFEPRNSTERWIENSCRGVYGDPYQKKVLGQSDDVIVSKYFKVDNDFDRRLDRGINVWWEGAHNQLTDFLIRDLQNPYAVKLGRAFKRNPSLSILAQVVHDSEHASTYVEATDNFFDEQASDRTSVKTLLALIMMQYRDLLKDQSDIVILLKDAGLKHSGLASTMLARMYLHGDMVEENIETFSNYIARGSGVVLRNDTILCALENVPDWLDAEMYRSLLNSSREMQASLNKKRRSERSANLKEDAEGLMRTGHEINQLVAEAIGASDEIKNLQVTGGLMQGEAEGRDNLIEIYSSQNSESKEIIMKHLNSNLVLDESSREKFEEANRKRLENHRELVSLQGRLALSFLGSNFQDAIEYGEYVNQYFRDSCNVTIASVQYANSVGVITPTVSDEQLMDDL